MFNNIKEIFIREDSSIKSVIGVIQKCALGIALVTDSQERLRGTVSDGDIRRAILKGADLDSTIKDIMNPSPTFAKDRLPEFELKRIMLNKGILTLPIVDEQDQVIDIIHITKLPRGLRQIGHASNDNYEKVKKVLVIGGSGYLGSHLVRLLLEKGYSVRVLDNLLYSKQGLSDIANAKNLEFMEGDIRNIDTLVNSIHGVDAVIHLAAIVGDPACGINTEFTLDVNYTATRTIAQLCVHHFIKRFLFASTCSVYGYSENLITEQSSVNPLSLYAKSKLESENGILDLMDGSFSPTILRLATLYGLSPRMRFDLVINLLTMKAVIDKEIVIDGGNQWRPYLHAYDAARAFLSALEAPLDKVKGEIFNVGSKEQCCQVIQLGEMIKEFIPEVKVNLKESAMDKRSYNVSCEKIRKILDFVPTKDIQDGILEIKEALESNRISNLDSKEYNNYKYLSEKLTVEE